MSNIIDRLDTQTIQARIRATDEQRRRERRQRRNKPLSYRPFAERLDIRNPADAMADFITEARV